MAAGGTPGDVRRAPTANAVPASSTISRIPKPITSAIAAYGPMSSADVPYGSGGGSTMVARGKRNRPLPTRSVPSCPASAESVRSTRYCTVRVGSGSYSVESGVAKIAPVLCAVSMRAMPTTV